MSEERRFDPKRKFATCEGDSRARYFQDGCYFDSRGQPLTERQAAKPAPGGTFDDQVEREVRKRTEPSESQLNQTITLHDPANPQNQRKETPEKAEEPQTPKPTFLSQVFGRKDQDPKPPAPGEGSQPPAAVTDPKPQTDTPDPGEAGDPLPPDPRLDKLRPLTIQDLNKMAKAAGGPVFRGTLAKSRAINWLLENTAA